MGMTVFAGIPETERSMDNMVTGELKSFLIVQVTCLVPLDIHTEEPETLFEWADTTEGGIRFSTSDAMISAMPNR